MAVGDHLGVKDEDEFSTGQKQTDSSVPALEICNVRMGFGGPPVLKDVSFKVAPGSIHGLLGANGAGKSTLVKILAGIYHPFPGSEITLWGQKITRKYTVPEKIGIGIVHQE
jgi:ribose transport system ATP-binding protein